MQMPKTRNDRKEIRQIEAKARLERNEVINCTKCPNRHHRGWKGCKGA